MLIMLIMLIMRKQLTTFKSYILIFNLSQHISRFILNLLGSKVQKNQKHNNYLYSETHTTVE